MFTSMGYHTFVISKNLTLEEAGSLWEAFKRYRNKTGERCRRELEEINNQLEIDLNDNTIQESYKKVKELTAEIAVLRAHFKTVTVELDERLFRLERLENEEHKLLDKAASELDEMDDTRRIIEYAEKELRVLQVYRDRLQEQKAERLSAAITDCFKIIISKRDLLDHIELDRP